MTNMKLQERVEKLQDILDRVDRSKEMVYEDITALCIDSRMSYFLVCSVLRERGISFENAKKRKVRIIGEMIEDGARLDKIARYLTIRGNTVLRYAHEAGYEIPKGWYRRNRKEVE